MFSKQPESSFSDLSLDLHDEDDWSPGILKAFDLGLDVTALAIEPISRLLAVGTSSGVIHIFGRPGVEYRIDLPQPIEVRFLQFAVSTYSIVCLDGENQLHVYSLLDFGRPKLVVSARFDQINSITLSPSHTHIFLATQHGDVKTFDLACRRKSPYSLPNLWKLYEEKMAASGVPLLSSDPSNAHAVDVAIHPRNLDLLFVAYASGIVLTDLTERTTIRTYELTIVPGAPGGGGYDSHDILTHRRPMVTSLTIHPSGHFFAAGYEDGSIAFWAIEDDEKPLLVRTLDSLDVNVLDPDHVEKLLSISEAPKRKQPVLPEPIFKLSWSSYPNSPDPRGGETTLTVLGGLTTDRSPGLTVFLLPSFNPTEAPSDVPTPASSIHPFYRTAMRESLNPKKTYFYQTRGIIQDHLLLPHSTPHFSGNHDPYAILLITEVDRSRTVEAYQFPPPGLFASIKMPMPQTIGEDLQVKSELSGGTGPRSSLSQSSRSVEPTPVVLRTPFLLSLGNSGLLGSQIMQLDKENYQTFIQGSSVDTSCLNLKGGQSYAETTNELKLLKYQPHRILVTHNRDLTIKFFDISPQLLLPNTAANSLLEHDWPEALPALTIDLREIFNDPKTPELLMSNFYDASIDFVVAATQALEVAAILKSGEIIVYHSQESRAKSPSHIELPDTEIVSLDHIVSQPGNKLTPYFLLISDKGPVVACALSDIGFLAISYQNGSLVIVDMRGPRIIYSSQKKSRRSRHSMLNRSHIHLDDSGSDDIRALAWTISSLETDSHLGVRLISVYQSGRAEVYTLRYSGNPVSWNVVGEPTPCKAFPEPISNGTFLLDKKTGLPLQADRARLAASFKMGGDATIPGQSRCFLVTVGAKGARSAADITGEKLGKVEWGPKVGKIQSAQVVEHMGSRALVVQTDKNDGLVFSLPYLENLCTIKLPPSSRPLAIEENGDFIAFTSDPGFSTIRSLSYGALFSARRTYIPPDIDFAITRSIVPSQPLPVSLGPASLLGSWFSYKQTLSGDSIDALLGGPDRPTPEQTKSDRDNATGLDGAMGAAASGFTANAAAVQSNIYNRLTSAMSERGQLLGDLEERFNSLEEGSRNMVAQAKRLAAQQTAKSWFGF